MRPGNTSMPAGNLLAEIPARLDAELVEPILTTDAIRIERIVSRGHHSAKDLWYDQSENEWVMVLAGSATIGFGPNRPAVTMRAGDYLEIPARTRHRVEWTDPARDTIWLAIFWPPGAPDQEAVKVDKVW